MSQFDEKPQVLQTHSFDDDFDSAKQEKFMPHPKDNSFIAVEYRKQAAKIAELEKQLEASRRAQLLETEAHVRTAGLYRDSFFERDQLAEKLRVAVEALEFYGDKSLPGAWDFRKKFFFDLISEPDLEELDSPIGEKGQRYVIGGKIARQALEKLKAPAGSAGNK